MFENTFNNIVRTLRNDEGLVSEVDYAERKSLLLLLKYLNELEDKRWDEAEEEHDYVPIVDNPYNWKTWSAKTRSVWYCQPNPERSLSKTNSLNEADLAEFVAMQSNRSQSAMLECVGGLRHMGSVRQETQCAQARSPAWPRKDHRRYVDPGVGTT